jgi:hypothetical protein
MWVVMVPRIEVVAWDEIGPFEKWGQAESERMKQRNNPRADAKVIRR